MTHDAKSPWHEGEIALQTRVGVADRMAVFGRKVIRDYMPEQHRAFYAQLPFLIAGVVDADGRPWATLLEAEPGFAQSPDPKTLRINTLPYEGDPARAALRNDNAHIGLLGIELHTRRRNRVNGRVSSDAQGLTLQVGHSFGNCPQYIQNRMFQFAPESSRKVDAETLAHLDEQAQAFIRKADTFFLASYVDLPNGERQIDASHRGGKTGFVRVDGNTLTIPDFAGNLHFNTLGNFLLNPQAGLLFIDFETGDVLQLTGRTTLILEGEQINHFQGAERLWTLEVTQAVRRRGALRLRWTLHDFSPNSLMTGSWEDAEAREKAWALRHDWRRFRIGRIETESEVIRSFYLQPTDGAGLPNFLAGQHLPIRVPAGENGSALIRTYTLSCAPSDGFYRISVKREGVVSRWLHDMANAGTEIEARAPQGQFTVDASSRRPLVLIAGGIGVTPMLAMLKHVVYEGLRTRRIRKTYFLQAARTLAQRAFDAELMQLLTQAQGQVEALRLLSEPESIAELGLDYEAQGQVDIELLKNILPLDDYDFYLCGPAPMVQAIYDSLRDIRVADDRIHAEAFGPSALKRRSDAPVAPAGLRAAEKPVPVMFSYSGKEARWNPGDGSLLELAEARGLTPEFSCRGGSCGTCKTRILAGEVSYAQPPAFKVGDDEALICCAQPAQSEKNKSGLVLEL